MNFKRLYLQLVDWFDSPSGFEDFDIWRHRLYQDQTQGKVSNLPLKTWWPKYSRVGTDFRLELCLGAILVQQISWPGVQRCLENLRDHLENTGRDFDAEGILSIPPETLEDLLRPSRFAAAKTRNILRLCAHLREQDSLDAWFRNRGRGEFGHELRELKSGFGPETRDCVLLYAANIPAFIADAYARKLLLLLTGHDWDYGSCQRAFEAGIERDFSRTDLEEIRGDYKPDELSYALCNSQKQDPGLVLLYQQFHAGIVELGISKRWEEFACEHQLAGGRPPSRRDHSQ